MGNFQFMENFMPSEIARLILGYLKETSCMKSWQAFLSESPHLREYEVLIKEGKEYPTNVGGKSLLQILQSYYVVACKGSLLKIDIAQQTDQIETSRPETVTILSAKSLVVPSTNTNRSVSQESLKQMGCSNITHQSEQSLSRQCKKTCSALHVKEGMLHHSCHIVPFSTAVSPMDTSEANAADLVVSCASAHQTVNVGAENTCKHPTASHCGQRSSSTVSQHTQTPQISGVSSVNCSHITQCPQTSVNTYSNHNCQLPSIRTSTSTTYSNHTCPLSSTAMDTSQSTSPVDTCVNRNGPSPSRKKTLSPSALQKESRTVVISVSAPRNVDATNVANMEGTEEVCGINSQKGTCENMITTTVCLSPVPSNSSHNVNAPVVSLNNAIGANRTVEYSPPNFLSQQRLLPSLNTPMKELSDLDEFFCSPKRKSLLPRRRLLSSFSPSQASAPGARITEDVELPNEEPADYSVLMEEFFKCTPLLEKIAENINKVVSTEQNQMAPSAKQITDSDLQFTSQVSHNHDAMIKDIVMRTESDPAFEDLLNSLCEKVDSSKDGFENSNSQNEHLEMNRTSSEVQQNKALKQTEATHSHTTEGSTATKQSTSVEKTVKETQSNTSPLTAAAAPKNMQNVESSQQKPPAASRREMAKNSEKTLTSHIESTVSASPNSVVVNEKLMAATQSTQSVALVTNLSGNITQTVALAPESSVVHSSNAYANSNTLVTGTRQPETVAAPSFQFRTLSPRHLYGNNEMPVPIAPKKVPNGIHSKPSTSSGPSVASRNSFVDRGSSKPVNRIPKDMVRRKPLRHIKPNILKAPAVHGQLAASSDNNSTSSQNNCPYNTTSTTGMPNSSVVEVPITRSMVQTAEKTSPRLKTLVTSAQTLARSAFLNKTHRRALDFGVVTNADSQEKLSNVTNQIAIVPSDVEGSIVQNKNQLLFTVNSLFEEQFNNEIIIYLNSPEVVSSDGTVTIPLNNGSETAYLTFTLPETNPAVAADSIVVAPSSTEDVVNDNQVVPPQRSVNSDSEVAETLVQLASSIPDSERSSNKVTGTTNKPSTPKRTKRPVRKRELRPKRRKIE